MIELNCDNGALYSGTGPLAYPGMDTCAFRDAFALVGSLKDGRSVIYTLTNKNKWLAYEVESIAVRFLKGRCSDVTLHLFGVEGDNGRVAADLSITEHLRRCLQSREEKRGNSEVRFYPSWGTVTCLFDFKLCAPLVSIRYK